MRLRRALIALLIAAGAALTAQLLTTVQLFEGLFGQLEYKTIDYRMRASVEPKRDSTDVVLVLFDSASIETWPYLSPFPRAMLAGLIDGVKASGAKAIGLDVFLDRQYPELNALDSGDVKLRDAIARAGNVILVGPTVQVDSLRVFQRPDSFFANVAAGLATADLPTPFETIRDGVLTVRTPDGLVPSFALALYARARGINLDSVLAAARTSGSLDLAGVPRKYAELASDAVQTVPIIFEGPPSRTGRDDGAFIAYSAADVRNLALAGVPLPWMKDKVVILGSGFHDSERFRTAFYDEPDTTGAIFGWTYGPEIHANATQNLLSSRYAVPVATPLVLLLLFLSAGLVTGAVFRYGTNLGAVTGVLLLIGQAVVSYVAFAQSEAVVPFIALAISIVLAFLGSTSYVSIIEGKEKRMIKGAFGKYLAPSVVEELVANPSALKLGGDRRHISMLFSDLAGFTSMSEVLDPERLVAVLNEYLHEMTDIVRDEGGYVDKYIGDAVMALYGAPNALHDHAVRACRSALRMQVRLGELNFRWRQQDPGAVKLKVRIGLNTGDPVVGNVGGEEKFNYTVLGDSVNLAARLEPACKVYGVNIMLSEQTAVEAEDRIQVRELDLLAVYGKTAPIRVYELLGMTGDDLGPEKYDLVQQYNKGLSAFRRRDFELAAQYFKAALEIDPNDGPSTLYIERCEDYMINPPPADWDFVERRQVK